MREAAFVDRDPGNRQPRLKLLAKLDADLVVPGPTTAAVTATTPKSSTAAPSTSAIHRTTTPAPATPDNHRSSDQTRAPWERLQVSISPLTREKVMTPPSVAVPR